MAGSCPQLGVGMIGYGFIGKMHTYAHRAIPFFYDPPPARTRLVAVCTAHEDTARKAAEQAGYAHAFTDFRRVVDHPEVDLVHICTPNAAHCEAAIAALEAGKHVYCDKPLARNLAEAEAILDAARRAPSHVKHQMTFQNRFLPATLRAKELVDEGLLGRVFSFRAAYLHAGYIEATRPMTWRTDAEAAGGGALLDLGSHVIDLMRHLLGEFARVSARCHTFIEQRPTADGRSQEVRVDDLALVHAELATGALGTLEASRLATGTNDELRFEIHGDQGALRFNLMDPNWLHVYDHRDPAGATGGLRGFKAIETVQRYPQPAVLPPPKAPVGWARGHVACLHDFLTCIAENRPACPSFEDGLAVQRIIGAAYASSSSEGRWMDVSQA